jgi:hypothetical protein
MKYHSLSVKRSIIIVWALLTVVCWAYAQNAIGDLRTNRNPSRTGTVSDWEIYTGIGKTGWETATGNITVLLEAAGKITMQEHHNVIVDADCTINCTMYNPNKQCININSDKTFTIGPDGDYQLCSMVVQAGGRVVNNGTISSLGPESSIELKDGPAPRTGGILENNGTITTDGNLNVGSYARIVSGPNGVIRGSGNIKVHDLGAGFTIANPGGYQAAIQLKGNQNVKNCCYIFNGAGDQFTGNLPEKIYNLTVAEGTNLIMTENITIIADTQEPKGRPFFRVEGGASLDTQNFIIFAIDCHIKCDSIFILEPGATIRTSNKDGISSIKGEHHTQGNRIQCGAIQTNYASYSCEANYIYYGNDEDQVSGYFETNHNANTVHDFIIENPNGLKINSQMEPLTVTGTFYSEGPVAGIYNQTLPVTMSYFNACFNGFDSVILQWETESETNNLGFYVLRSSEPDATRAKIVSALVSATNSSQGAAYCFEDNSFYEDGTYYYWLQDVSFAGQMELHGPAMAQVTLNGGSSQTPDIPLKTSFVRNFPNPFNPCTQLEYYLEQGADVDFKVYNVKGQLVDQFTLRNQASGLHRFTWEPQLGSGVYLVRFTAAGKSNTRRVILSK